jgi:HlyD family secretion protein
MTTKKILLMLLLVLGVGTAFYYLKLQKQPLQVWVSAVQTGAVEASVSNTRAGTVNACRRSRLSMPTGGVVDRLLVKEGDKVEQGQLLLELWNHDRRANLAQMEQSYKAVQHDAESACLLAEFKRRDAQRKTSLAARSLTSEEEVDAASTASQSQQRLCAAAKDQQGVVKAQLEYQQALLDRTQLRAPFAGVIAEINGEAGEYVTPSPPGVATPPAVDLIDYSCLYVTAPIDEVDASRLQIGLPVKVTLDAYGDIVLQGEVIRIAPYVLDLAKQARTVDIDVGLLNIPDTVSLLVGYSADISVILASKPEVMRLPTEAILPGNRVWVLSQTDGQLSQRSIETGIGNWSFTEVLSGLAEGELVVSSPDQPGIAEGVTAVAVDD